MSVPQKELAFRVRLLVNLQNVFPDVNDGDFRFRLRASFAAATSILQWCYSACGYSANKKHSIS